METAIIKLNESDCSEREEDVFEIGVIEQS